VEQPRGRSIQDFAIESFSTNNRLASHLLVNFVILCKVRVGRFSSYKPAQWSPWSLAVMNFLPHFQIIRDGTVFTVEVAANSNEAWSWIEVRPPDILMVQASLDGSLELCRWLKTDESDLDLLHSPRGPTR